MATKRREKNDRLRLGPVRATYKDLLYDRQMARDWRKERAMQMSEGDRPNLFTIITSYGYNKRIISIIDCGTKGYCLLDDKVVWSREFIEAEFIDEQYPEDVRKEYERLMKRGEFLPEEKTPLAKANVVEMVAGNDCAWDQPCLYGYRVDSHAVYCHNEGWLYAPRKCRRNKSWPHEQCRGYKENPAWARLVDNGS